MRVHVLKKEISNNNLFTRFQTTGEDCEVLAETETHYKLRRGMFGTLTEWVPKELCEVIKDQPTQ